MTMNLDKLWVGFHEIWERSRRLILQLIAVLHCSLLHVALELHNFDFCGFLVPPLVVKQICNESKQPGRKVCRHNLYSAGSLGWPFPMLKYKYIVQTKYSETILSNSTRKLLWFEISKMMTAVKNKFIVLFVIIFGTLSSPTADSFTVDQQSSTQ